LVVHHEPLDQLHAGERREEVFTAAFAFTHVVKAKAAPNFQNRKWLNFQDKIERKSKVSKRNDVETVETVEGAEVTRNGHYNRQEGKPCLMDSHIGSRIFLGQPIFLAICGKNSRVRFITGC
jgi:hypothetical protein